MLGRFSIGVDAHDVGGYALGALLLAITLQ